MYFLVSNFLLNSYICIKPVAGAPVPYKGASFSSLGGIHPDGSLLISSGESSEFVHLQFSEKTTVGQTYRFFLESGLEREIRI